MKRISGLMASLLAVFISHSAMGATGLLFDVRATGTPADLDISLCLNGNSALSCQDYTVSALTLHISTTIPNRVYSAIGIKVNSSGYVLSGCTPIANGYCLFSANDTTLTRITVRRSDQTIVLAPSVALLALAVNCQPSAAGCVVTNAALTGNSRYITITNTGTASATDVSVASMGLPSGTTISSTTCGRTLDAGASCQITITPGEVATSDCTSGTVPSNGTITVSSKNVPSSVIDVVVLSYGCQYQGGFVYSVDDTTVNTGSIGGTVASLNDQAEPYLVTGPQATSIIWSSNGAGAAPQDVDISTILGIDESSTTSAPSPTSPAYPAGTPAYLPCDGSTVGACDSSNILSYYNVNRASGGSAPTPLTYYAAGLCTATINNYSDWYLPAICEMDAVHISFGVNCPTGTQSMFTGLSFLIGDPSASTPSQSCFPPNGTDCLAGAYWSSVEYSGSPNTQAWQEYFTNNGSSNQSFIAKNLQFGVRCSRALTF